MADENWDWVDNKEKEIEEEKSKGYFNIVEGKQQFILLSHTSPLAQVYDPGTKKYRVAVEGDKGASIKGVCWVLQDGLIKQAKLPFTIVKAIRALKDDPEWEFQLPFPHTLTLSAKDAGTKEVEYNITPSPKRVEIPAEILAEYAKKPTPEAIIEKIKEGKAVSPRNAPIEDTREAPLPDYPTEDINPEDIPL